MATVSPTPFGVSAFGTGRTSHYTTSRTYNSRPNLKRHSPISVLGHGHGFSADAPMIQRISIGDSSDDEIPQPMNFSALTKAILEDRPSIKMRSPVIERDGQRPQQEDDANDKSWSKSRAGTPPSRGTLRVIRRSPPTDVHPSDASSPRVVQLSGSRHERSLRRSLSKSEARLATSLGNADAPEELVTPAPITRERPSLRRALSSMSNNAHTSSSSSAAVRSADTEHQNGRYHASGNASSEEQGPASVYESASRNNQTGGVDSVSASTRAKRALMTRSVRGAPMRRPVRQRQDEDEIPGDEEHSDMRDSAHVPLEQSPPSADQMADTKAVQAQVAVHDFAENKASVRSPHGPLASIGSISKHEAAPDSANDKVPKLISPLQAKTQEKPMNLPIYEQHMFKMPALPPAIPSIHDQENEPPPTFKRNKPLGAGVLGRMEKLSILNENKPSKMLITTPLEKSPPRQALLPLNVNTPQRGAPPPPKMTVLETATATGGASTVKSKKKRTHITVNGKMFSLRGRLGKGGSSDVYRVMAENDKMFALKKVNLEDCNEDTVRGYKGEIELLKMLENVDRVVRLFDWEVNESKQSLSVLMEIGESDLNRILSTRIHPENARLDLSFTRHYWREMLCCVEAVHAHDIVHSDLKPANFLLIQGRLKLIDFGIANAIDVDNTVNVHRETNVGTPNYMSPESLQDTNANQRAAAGPSGGPSKLMKLGKPSDVWSLGCILYQMTYGKPPFAHIANQWNRVMAIINPAVHITFPETGIGGVSVPLCLRDLLRTCLDRDAAKRPTVSQLLDPRERFLNPDRDAEKWERDGAVPMTEHVLEQILMRIVERCRDPKRGVPTDEEVKVYPKAFLDRVRGVPRG